MSESLPNQHYVSQVLQRRFADGPFLQRFDLKWKKWKRVSTASIFSRVAYSQLLAFGQCDNSLDEAFQKHESALPETLGFLDDVANRGTSEVPDSICSNLFWYCTFLWLMSPFKKAVSPLDFTLQLNLDLNHGVTKLLDLMGVSCADVQTIRNLHSQGMKFILCGENQLQSIFRINFKLKYGELYDIMAHFANWKLNTSPIILPLSDCPFFTFDANKTALYIFTISPTLVLVGNFPAPPIQRKAKVTVATDTLNVGEAEYIRDAICLSAITAIASKTKGIDVLAARNRARQYGVVFPKIKDLDAVLLAGTSQCNTVPRVFPVPPEVYTQYLKSFTEGQA